MAKAKLPPKVFVPPKFPLGSQVVESNDHLGKVYTVFGVVTAEYDPQQYSGNYYYLVATGGRQQRHTLESSLMSEEEWKLTQATKGIQN